jgi:ABC-type transport system substrate-binding protein
MKRNKMLSLLLALALVLSLLGGCGSKPAAAPAPGNAAETTYTLSLGSDIVSLDPSFA